MKQSSTAVELGTPSGPSFPILSSHAIGEKISLRSNNDRRSGDPSCE
jgi:hypothetical protein